MLDQSAIPWNVSDYFSVSCIAIPDLRKGPARQAAEPEIRRAAMLGNTGGAGAAETLIEAFSRSCL